MILIGDKHIKCEKIDSIKSISDIQKTAPNSTVIFNFDIEILKYTYKNAINSAVKVNSIKEVIYASSFGAKYIITDETILLEAQKIADNYMFDSKILAIIEDENQIEKVALEQIDGAIYNHILN